ncbi:MAG: porin [Holophaga sp.]|nr:porin [Holophaga sp.]
MKISFAIVAAATVVATTLPAQTAINVTGATDITISGLLAVGAKDSQITNTRAAHTGAKAEQRLDDNTSRLVISSTSKITDGWRVIFRVESRFQADVRPSTPIAPGGAGTGNYAGWADGDTWGGIASPWGSLVFGKSTLYYTDTISMPYLGMPAPGEGYRIWDDNGLGTFNMLDSVPIVYKGGTVTNSYTNGNTRSQNVLRFDSVAFNGFKASLAYTKNPDGDENRYVAPGTAGYARNYESGGTWYFRGLYDKGPIDASLSYENKQVQGGTYTSTATSGPLDMQAIRLGVSYTFDSKFKVGVVFDNTSYDNGVNQNNNASVVNHSARRSVFLVPISYSFGDHAVYATYAKAGNVSSVSNTGASQLNLGYDYALTKRAFAGVYFTGIVNQSNAHYAPFLANTTFGPTGNNTGENFHQIGIDFNYWF